MLKQQIARIATTLALLLLATSCGRADGGTATAPTQPQPAPSATPVPSAAPVPSTQPAGADPLDGSKWSLQSYGPAGQPKQAAGQATAEFAAGKISGNSTCNSFSGSYTAGGADLKIADMISTMMACADQALMQQESDYVNALGAARSFALAGDQLTISYDVGELRFTRQAPVADRPLEGRWQLTTFVAGESASSLLAGTEISAELAGGRISGKAGCNSYSGDYTVSGANITVSQVGTTKMACSDEIMAQEGAFLGALAAATGYSIAGDQLTVPHPGGQLIFTAAP